MKKWEALPEEMQNEKVKPYYDMLCHKTGSIVLKRIFDIIVGLIILIIVMPFMIIIAVWIKCDSKGKVFFKQKRGSSCARQGRKKVLITES